MLAVESTVVEPTSLQEDKMVVGNFSPCTRSFEHTSYKCSEGNRIEAENGITDRPFERVPRKETRNEKDYMNMDEDSMKPSLLEKSSTVNELLQAIIEINGSVEMHVEGEMSKEDFGDSMSDMSFEEEESIEFEKRDRVEEKERLVEKSSFLVFISSLGEKCEKDESSKEEENDLEGNERTKEMRIKDGRSMEKDLGPILEDLSMTLSLNPSSLCYEVSLEELKSLLDSYNFQVCLVGDMCMISF
ncbi:hypothetical protein M9H77_18874 [Catharanthus roseus]|uniref:Uncharacterized protein n=1 Tax=Catharanthus roseus TaxID=4058 RepID=A0ACC0B8P4_CATRO|nr:hypothetical protein M9H77_18874 [Catharanthus roseus]